MSIEIAPKLKQLGFTEQNVLRIARFGKYFDTVESELLANMVLLEKIYEDQASGKKDDRSGLASCLKALREEDTLVVWKLDRLGRDLKHLVNTVQNLSKNNIGFKVLTGQGANITP